MTVILADEVVVASCIVKIVQLIGVAYFDPDDPSLAIRVRIDDFGRGFEFVIEFNHFTGNRHEQV